jgi:predicted dehydrogenase
MGTLRIGLIGAGFIGIMHANAIESIIDGEFVNAKLAGVCDTDATRAEAVAGAFGAGSHWDDPIALIESGDIDTVFICTPTASHPKLVEAAAARGLNVFCEKPLARSLGEAQAMHAAVAEAGVKNQVGLVLRFSPVFHTIKRLVGNKDMGRPMSIIFRDDQYFPVQGIYGSSWRGDFEIAGGGTLIEHSIHDVDIMRWLFGEVASLSGSMKYFSGRDRVEDVAAVQMEFANGCVAQLTSIWHNVLARESNRYIEIFMENGYISTSADFIGPVSFQAGKDDIEIIPAEHVLDEYLSAAGLEGARFNLLRSMQELQDYQFLKALEDGEDPAPDFGEAVKAHEIVEAAYESARNNSPVTLGD